MFLLKFKPAPLVLAWEHEQGKEKYKQVDRQGSVMWMLKLSCHLSSWPGAALRYHTWLPWLCQQHWAALLLFMFCFCFGRLLTLSWGKNTYKGRKTVNSTAWSCWKTRFTAPSPLVTVLWVKLHHQCYGQLLQHGAVSSGYLKTQQMDCITSSNSLLKSGCWTEQEAPVQLETVTWFELKQSSFLHFPCSINECQCWCMTRELKCKINDHSKFFFLFWVEV